MKTLNQKRKEVTAQRACRGGKQQKKTPPDVMPTHALNNAKIWLTKKRMTQWKFTQFDFAIRTEKKRRRSRRIRHCKTRNYRLRMEGLGRVRCHGVVTHGSRCLPNASSCVYEMESRFVGKGGGGLMTPSGASLPIFYGRAPNVLCNVVSRTQTLHILYNACLPKYANEQRMNSRMSETKTNLVL